MSVTNHLYSQNLKPIDLTENTLKIGAISEEFYYYAFSEGDQIILNFEELNGKELKEVDISEYPSNVKFSDFKTKIIKDKIINVTTTSIYKFRFYNSSLSLRTCKIKIQRVPTNQSLTKFNSTVYWEVHNDTIYTPREEKYLINTDTIAEEIYSSSPQISSQNALNGNKNYQIIDFVLPKNTISWSFCLGTGEEAKKEYESTMKEFETSTIKSVSKISGYTAIAHLALTGINLFKQSQGENNVKYWFLSDANSVSLFESGQTFFQYKKGDVKWEASKMEFPKEGKIYIALENDNSIESISCKIKVVAVKTQQNWGVRIVQDISVNTWKEPYLK